MTINLNQDQLAIVADRLSKIKNLEIDLKTEKSKLDDFILGVATANSISGSFSWKLEKDKLEIDDSSPTA